MRVKQAVIDLHLGPDVTLFSGGCRGADMLGESLARWYGWHIRRFLPDWDAHGKAAGPMRNAAMAREATHLVLIWDGASRGSASMLREAQKAELTIKEIRL